MSSSVLLSQETTSQPGVNLKWAYTPASANVKEISLIYFQNTSDANIQSIDVASGVLRTNLALGLVSGQAYTFQLQVVDITENIIYSNALILTAPWFLSTPVITSVSGLDSALSVQLGATTDVMTDKYMTVEFVLKRADNELIWIIKPYTSSGQYTLSAIDDARLQNNTSYRVACMIQPSASNSRYKSPSPMSNSFNGTPSNLPDRPTSVSVSSVGVGTLDLSMTWDRPADFAQWSSSNYVITLKLISSVGDVMLHTISNLDVTQYAWSDLPEGKSYYTTVQYSNVFGVGPVSSQSNTVQPSRVPFGAALLAVTDEDQASTITWSKPSSNGQSFITAYKVYKGETLLTTVSASTMSYQDTGLQNGSSYVSAVNDVGESTLSSSLTARPYGQMSIVSVLASGKTLTATLNPNGRPIKNVVLVTVDHDPNDLLDSEFVIAIPQQEISQVANSNITVIKNFSDFSSDIAFFCCIAHNETNSTFYKSS